MKVVPKSPNVSKENWGKVDHLREIREDSRLAILIAAMVIRPPLSFDGNAQLDHDGARMGIRIRPAPQLNRDRPGALYWGS